MNAYEMMGYNPNSPYWLASIQANSNSNHRHPIVLAPHPFPVLVGPSYSPPRPRRPLPMDRHRRCYSVHSGDVYVLNPTTQKQPTRDRRTSAPHTTADIAIYNNTQHHSADHRTATANGNKEKQPRVFRKPLPLVIPKYETPASKSGGSRPQQKPPLPPPPAVGSRQPVLSPVHSPQQRLLLRSPLSDRYSRPPTTTSRSSSTTSSGSGSGSHSNNSSNGNTSGRSPSPNISIMPKQPTFWNPRSEDSTNDGVSIISRSSSGSGSSSGSSGAVLLRRNLSRRLRGLLQPQRAKADSGAAVREKHKALQIWSVERPLTPLNNNNKDSAAIRPNPFLVLANTLPVADQLWDQDDGDHDFQQIDTYAANVQQRGPMLTPTLLAQKFLARPYRRELFKLRSIFTWIVQNIGPAQNSDDSNDSERTCSLADAAEQVLMTRECRSPAGMANLFCVMAQAVGHDEAHVVYGYLRGPKDSIDTLHKATERDQPILENHAWVALQVEGEYRFVDCWLASPYYPDNHRTIETHWFLCKPADMIFTHLPSDSAHQYLEPPISLITFFSLPYVTMPYFLHHVQVLDFDPSCLDLVDDSLCHLTLALDPDVGCFAEVETLSIMDKTNSNSSHDSNPNKTGTTTPSVIKMRGLAQCTLSPTSDERICKIKAALPPNQLMGWLKIYCGPRIGNQEKVGSHHYPLALIFRLTRRRGGTTSGSGSGEQQSASVIPAAAVPQSTAMATAPFEFVQLHLSQFDLYVQEPQCFYLYPMQRYVFRVKSDHSHHKLAIRSPTGRMYKLMYYPHDHTYDGTVSINDVGQWSLVCLLHHAGGINVIASWECKN